MAASKAPAAPMARAMPSSPTFPGPPGSVGPQGLPVPPVETLEQRIYDLLAPFREADIDADGSIDLPSRKSECKALILCGKYSNTLCIMQLLTRTPENIAFIIRHNQTGYGKHIESNDVSFAAKSWADRITGSGFVGICIFVNGNGFSHTVLRTTMAKGENVVDKLFEKTDELLQPFFPDI
ncbi:hypothetical protein ST47_g2314 [Ascochyta rabiei]|uniref:Uncharacterized protein n=2 Tax=Didymella rabiei TaxID=5454 RepID=A0A163JVW2_DIDRA|nr:hypothetical protein ST47_g2314 [Ascochyta rabiei]